MGSFTSEHESSDCQKLTDSVFFNELPTELANYLDSMVDDPTQCDGMVGLSW